MCFNLWLSACICEVLWSGTAGVVENVNSVL